MGKLIVVRHGHSIGNIRKVIDDNSGKNDKNHLSKEGKQQARIISKELEKYNIDAIIVSQLIRTHETVAPYLKKHKIKVIVSKLTNERNAGVFTGKPWNALADHCSSKKLDRVTFRPKGGESLVDTYKKAKKFLTYLKKNFNDKTVLLCGHVRFLDCLDIVINKKDIKKLYSYESLKNGEIRIYEF